MRKKMLHRCAHIFKGFESLGCNDNKTFNKQLTAITYLYICQVYILKCLSQRRDYATPALSDTFLSEKSETVMLNLLIF